MPRSLSPPATTTRSYKRRSLAFRHQAGHHIFTTTPTTARKRKASEADNYLSPAEEPPQKRKTSRVSAIDLPATPATNAGKMDSDDEFNSSQSGNDFDDQDSDLDLEDGA